MKRLWARLRDRDRDSDRGAALPEYAILIAGSFAAINGAGDLAAGGMNSAFNGADDGVANRAAVVEVVDDEEATEPSDEETAEDGTGTEESGGGSSSGGSSGDESGGDVSSTAPGTGTIGYWKNHPEAWPTTTLIIGSTGYDQDELIDIMNTNGNKPAAMAKQLIAVELNILAGNGYDCVTDAVNSAHSWLVTYPVGTSGSAVNTAWDDTGDAIKTTLDEYNNGNLACAEHRG